MKTRILFACLALLSIGGMISTAQASLQVIGDPVESGSWHQAFNESGVGNYDFMGVWMLSAGDSFETPVFRSLSAGWADNLVDPSALRATAMGPSTTNMNFDIYFSGASSNPLVFDFIAFLGNTVLETARATWTGSGWIIAAETTNQFARVGNDIQLIPEPATIAIWGLLSLICGGLGLGFWQRGARPGVYPSVRTPWSSEARTAILQIIERGRTQ
jgi:hypothetical protein